MTNTHRFRHLTHHQIRLDEDILTQVFWEAICYIIIT
jgi:hypothetical protein